MPMQQHPMAHAGAAADTNAEDQHGGGEGREVYAGGSVDGEVTMDAAPRGDDDDSDLLSQAAAVLGDATSTAEL